MPLEGGAVLAGEIRGRALVGAEGVVALEFAHGAVLHVDMVARRDVGGGDADDLVVFAHIVAGGEWRGSRSCGPTEPGWQSPRLRREWSRRRRYSAPPPPRCRPGAAGWWFRR